jgi:hypothetical protein
METGAERAVEAGMSYMDLFMPSAAVRDGMGRLMKGRRERFQECGARGVAIVAMKPYAAGWALKPDNPAGAAVFGS